MFIKTFEESDNMVKHIRLIALLRNVVGFTIVGGRVVVFVGDRGFLVDGFIVGSHNWEDEARKRKGPKLGLVVGERGKERILKERKKTITMKCKRKRGM